jgi:hypothetical protein
MIMLCEICHERNATVHLTWKYGGEPDRTRDLCTVCFPPTMTEKQEAEMVRRLFNETPANNNPGS